MGGTHFATIPLNVNLLENQLCIWGSLRSKVRNSGGFKSSGFGWVGVWHHCLSLSAFHCPNCLASWGCTISGSCSRQRSLEMPSRVQSALAVGAQGGSFLNLHQLSETSLVFQPLPLAPCPSPTFLSGDKAFHCTEIKVLRCRCLGECMPTKMHSHLTIISKPASEAW